MASAIHLGPFHGKLFQPDYQLLAYRNGNPKKPIRSSALDLRSVVSIQTSKNTNDLSGTFQIVLKDRRARSVLREMDVITIKLRGHHSNSLVTVIKGGVVDRVVPTGNADPSGSQENTLISGRCAGKYLQINSLFLPVWDADGALPTALTFGIGDVTQKGKPANKAGGTTPFDIFSYLVTNYVYGAKGVVGTSGTPNSVHWLDHKTRFARKLFNVPFLQFNEDSLATALKSLEVLGFTETWVDELGRIVYRRPQWDAPVRYVLSTGDLIDWSFPRSDEQTATYVEVIPAGDPGIDSSTAQALRAGRAPVPSTYVKAKGHKTQLGKTVSERFIIETDGKGKPTATGRKNPWYQRQRRLGLRPQQVTAPLLASQAQAQASAEGLLRFFSRMDKGLEASIPGCPELRLGFNLRCHGELEGVSFDRSGYLEQIQHQYVESPDGGQYTTQFVCTHGRDARDPFTGHPDPLWGKISLPKFSPKELASQGGTLDSGGGGGDAGPVGGSGGGGGSGSETNGEAGNGKAYDARGVHASVAVSGRLTQWRNPGGNIVWVCTWMIPQLRHALQTGKWSGVITEGWRSRATEEVYWERYGHDPGRAAPPGTSRHGLTIYPNGAIDTADPAGLQRALVSWRGERPALIGNGTMLPRDIVHFSSSGR